MRVYDIIENKKNGKKLTKSEIDFFIDGVVSNEVEDCQISAFCMAVLLKGMDDDEVCFLTEAMMSSGEVMKKTSDGIFVDKHSTGGVSDSTTLIITPILACLGLKVAKLSGRGLGHTGGTLDKLESFKNININLTAEEFENQVNKIGCAVSGQTENSVYADKRMYAVRDITATIDSIPLIASSVMSKKLASFADIILLDVKYGNGAFMKTEKDALSLALCMVKIGNRLNRKTMAIVSDMNQPLGDNIGCNLEVLEALQILKGRKNNLYTLSKLICAKFLKVAFNTDEQTAFKKIDEVISNGEAYDKLKRMISFQKGETLAFENEKVLNTADNVLEIKAEKAGFITKIDGLTLGKINCTLGGGRVRKSDKIDHTVGIELIKKVGDNIEIGDVLCKVYYITLNNEIIEILKPAFTIAENKPKEEKLIYAFVDNDGKILY